MHSPAALPGRRETVDRRSANHPTPRGQRVSSSAPREGAGRPEEACRTLRFASAVLGRSSCRCSKPQHAPRKHQTGRLLLAGRRLRYPGPKFQLRDRTGLRRSRALHRPAQPRRTSASLTTSRPGNRRSSTRLMRRLYGTAWTTSAPAGLDTLIESGGYRSPESQWPEIQSQMVDTMSRLEAALRPHLASLEL